MRVAIAHDYVTQRGGAERVVLALLRAFPDAELCTLLYEPSSAYPAFRNARIRVSWLNRVGFLRRHHRWALPFLPFAARSMRVDADVVIASSSGWAHGFTTNGKMLVYCYSPARWLYESEGYLGGGSAWKRILLGALRRPLVRWDKRAAARADRYLAVSSVVRDRIKTTYGIDAAVVPSPQTLAVDDSQTPVALPSQWPAKEYYLCVSRLLPYKYVDVVVDAFQEGDRRLVVVGQGPDLVRLKAHASSNVTFLSGLSDSEMRWLYANCRALVSASYEDFGLTPLEAGVYGRPSIVPRQGGYLDTVIEDVTGVFFDERRADALAAAVSRAETISWDPGRISAHAGTFSEQAFIARVQEVLTQYAS